MTLPTLSICVPSRNRQRYFKETIGFLLENPRDAFQEAAIAAGHQLEDAGDELYRAEIRHQRPVIRTV